MKPAAGLSAEELARAELALQVRAAQLGVNQPHVRSRRDTFHGFVQRVNPGLLLYEHVPRLVDVAERVLRGELKRVLVMLPPRYFKSEVFSRLLPAEFLRRSPELWAAVASYAANLAWDLSGEARDYFEQDGGFMLRDTTAKRYWRTDQRGGMWAAGVGGGTLGFGFHLGIVDDPMDPERATSPKGQKRFQAWWPSKWLYRMEPGAAMVVVMQRLGDQDAIDFLLRSEVGEDTEANPQNWHVVVCDEIKSDTPLGRWDGPQGLPPTCTLEPDPRQEGELLSPSRFNEEQVEAKHRGPTTVVSAQLQQRPAAPTGDFWREEWFQTYDKLPDHAFNGGKDWDTAYTKDDRNAASGFVESYRGPDRVDENGKAIPGTFPIYIENCDWEWVEFPELVATMRREAGPHYVEAKASGKSAVQTLKREHVMAKEVRVQGDKLARASNVQPVVAQGRVYVRSSIRKKLLEGDRQGLLRVTSEALATGDGDLDLNDMVVQALTRHTGGMRRFGVYYPGMKEEDAA